MAAPRCAIGGHKLIDAEVIKHNIELTRFPVPKAEDHQDTVYYPGLVRVADLIGQLSDPRYLNKITSLFYEFEETGQIGSISRIPCWLTLSAVGLVPLCGGKTIPSSTGMGFIPT